MSNEISTASLPMPRITISELAQRNFFAFDFQTRYKILSKLKQVLEEDISYENERQEELNRCETLVQLGASNLMILSTLSNVIEESDIQAIRRKLNISASGRIKSIPQKERYEIYRLWQSIIQNNSGCLKDEYECWIVLADYYPNRTIGELHKAVRSVEQQIQMEARQ